MTPSAEFLLLLLVVTAFISLGVTQMAKMLLKAIAADKETPWWHWGLRTFSAAIGTGAGWWLGEKDPWSISVGFIAGCFASLIVFYVKRFAITRIQQTSTPTSPTGDGSDVKDDGPPP